MAQQGGGQQQGDQTSSFFWYVVLITVACIVIWFCFKKYLIPPLFYLREAEVFLLENTLRGWNYFAAFLHLPKANVTELRNLHYSLATAFPKEVTIEQVEQISSEIGSYYRFPVALISLVFAYFCAFRHRSAKFTMTYSMGTLLQSEAKHWPQIRPVVSEDILNEDINQGEWAMSTLPMDFCKQHGLLQAKTKNGKKIWAINHGAAERQFVMQMGPLWEGVDALPIHLKALLVVFIMRLERQRKESEAILNRIGASANSGQLDFSGIEALVEKYKNHKVLVWLQRNHAHIFTFFASLLEIARSEGVLATAEFLWLKPLDRRLWYVLNAVGRVTSVVEVAGVFAHWQAEKKLRRAMRTPVVTEAVLALDQAVSEILYVAEGETWHTDSAA